METDNLLDYSFRIDHRLIHQIESLFPRSNYINISFSSIDEIVSHSSFRRAKSFSDLHAFLSVFTINRKTFLAPGARVQTKIASRVLNCNPILPVSNGQTKSLSPSVRFTD